MLDSLIFRDSDDPGKDIFLYTAIYTALFTAVSLILTRQFLPFRLNSINLEGPLAVILTTLALIYPLTNYLRSRDRNELREHWSETSLIKRHVTEVKVYLALFFAASLIFSIGYLLIPSAFQAQEIVLGGVDQVQQGIGAVTGKISGTKAVFTNIVTTNFAVFLLTLILSFAITGGMIFILIWNASVLGARIGQITSHIIETPLTLISYLPHGIFEIGGYIFAGLAGTLLAYHLEHYLFQQTHSKETFYQTLQDSAVMLYIGTLLIIAGAGIETYLITLLA